MRRVEIDLFSFTLASRREYLCSRLARLSTNLQSRIERIEISLREKTKICWNHAVYRLYQNLIFISRKRYFQLSTPLFFPLLLFLESISKTVDKLNSTSPVRKQLATIELKVSNLSRKHELAKPVLKQRVLSISLTFSSSRPSISQIRYLFRRGWLEARRDRAIPVDEEEEEEKGERGHVRSRTAIIQQQ